MDAYPKDYVKHNLPLVLLSGLGKREDDGDSESLLPRQESGTRIQGSSPECGGDRARLLFDQFLAMDGSNVWQNASSLPGPAGSMKFKFKTIGRVGTRRMRADYSNPCGLSPQLMHFYRAIHYHRGRLHHFRNLHRLKDLQVNLLEWNCIRHFPRCLLDRLYFRMDYSLLCGLPNTKRTFRL